MPDNRWITTPESLRREDVLAALVIAIFRDIHETTFADEMMVNHQLPVEVRAIRDIGEWRVFLLLTPWMLARLYLRFDAPEIKVPNGWCADSRTAEPYVVLGPGVTFSLLGQEQKVYLNYQPELGHYLIQPLIMRMEPFLTAKEVYESWNEVIRTRDETIRERQLECQWQKEVSRREFFARLARG